MRAKDLKFILAPEVAALGVKCVCFVIEGLANRAEDVEFERYKSDLFTRLMAQYTTETVSDDPVLAGFRSLHSKVGRSNRKFPASPERLIKMFLKNSTVPPINLAVDIYNCVSLKTRLSLGAHDVQKIDGNATLRLTDGGERFVPLGKGEPEPVPAGDYCYVDDSGDVLCRLEYRQADKTKVTLTSDECFYIVQGNENTPEDEIMNAAELLIDLTKRYCGGRERIVWT